MTAIALMICRFEFTTLSYHALNRAGPAGCNRRAPAWQTGSLLSRRTLSL
jgi:hypothetical protein